MDLYLLKIFYFQSIESTVAPISRSEFTRSLLNAHKVNQLLGGKASINAIPEWELEQELIRKNILKRLNKFPALSPTMLKIPLREHLIDLTWIETLSQVEGNTEVSGELQNG